jgi:hypothetical protein
MKYLIRFNQSRGQEGRGTLEHVWRVFEGDEQKEYLFKHINIQVPVDDEQTGDVWNIRCYGALTIDRETSTAIIK